MIKALNPCYRRTERWMQRYLKGKTDGFKELIVQRDCSHLAWETGKPGPGTVLKDRHTELEESPDPSSPPSISECSEHTGQRIGEQDTPRDNVFIVFCMAVKFEIMACVWKHQTKVCKETE